MEQPHIFKERLEALAAEARARKEQQRLVADRLASVVPREIERQWVQEWVDRIEKVALKAAEKGQHTRGVRYTWDGLSEATRERHYLALARDFFGDNLLITLEDHDSDARNGADGYLAVDAHYSTDVQISFGVEAETIDAKAS